MAKPNRRTVIIVAMGLLLGLGLLTWRMNMWKRYQGKVQGTRVEGDRAAPPTKWWNHWYLALWGWKIVTVFEVSKEAARHGYQLGYLPFDGKAMIKAIQQKFTIGFLLHT